MYGDRESPRRVVILGAGFLGLRTAESLSQTLGRRKREGRLLLIDRNDRFLPGAGFALRLTECGEGLAGPIPLSRLLPRDVGFLQAEVENLDPVTCQVRTDRGVVSFRELVVALGSEISCPSIPGLHEYAFFSGRPHDEKRLNRHLRERFKVAAGEGSVVRRRALLRVAVAGGGPAGCQLAGELSHWLPALADEYRAPLQDIHILLLEKKPRLLPRSRRSQSHRAEAILRRKAVDVLTSTALTRVSAGRIYFHDEALNCETLIWAGGMRVPSLLSRSGLPLNREGRLWVDDSLRSLGFPGIHAGGSCAAMISHPSLRFDTMAELMRQGRQIGANIEASFEGRRPSSYQPLDKKELISLGGDEAVGDVLGVPVDGFLAGWAKRFFEDRYRNRLLRALAGSR